MIPKNYEFQVSDYNAPEILDSYELDTHVKYLKELSSEVSKSIDLYLRELNNRLHKK